MAGFSTEGVMPMAPYGGGGMDGMGFGQGGGWIVFLIIAMMFGWGRNGMGAGAGGFTGGETFADQFALQDIKNGIEQTETVYAMLLIIWHSKIHRQERQLI